MDRILVSSNNWEPKIILSLHPRQSGISNSLVLQRCSSIPWANSVSKSFYNSFSVFRFISPFSVWVEGFESRVLLGEAAAAVTVWDILVAGGKGGFETPLLTGTCWLPVSVLAFAGPLLNGSFWPPDSVLASEEHFVSVACNTKTSLNVT